MVDIVCIINYIVGCNIWEQCGILDTLGSAHTAVLVGATTIEHHYIGYEGYIVKYSPIVGGQ